MTLLTDPHTSGTAPQRFLGKSSDLASLTRDRPSQPFIAVEPAVQDMFLHCRLSTDHVEMHPTFKLCRRRYIWVQFALLIAQVAFPFAKGGFVMRHGPGSAPCRGEWHSSSQTSRVMHHPGALPRFDQDLGKQSKCLAATSFVAQVINKLSI